MPSALHEILVQLFRERPSLAIDFVAGQLGLPLPVKAGVEILSGEIEQTSAPQHRADTVLLFGGPAREGRLGIVLEVQLTIDSAKRFAWPVYLAGIRAKLRCPVVLVVVTPDRTVRKWASSSISLGPGGSQVQPLVLGPEEIPVVTDVSVARKNPDLALLSVIAHGEGPEATPVGMAALVAARDLDEEKAKVYADIVWTILGPRSDQVQEALMQSGFEGYEYQSEFARKYVAQGRAEGEAKGKAEGKAEGEAKGKAEGKADALLAVLAARALPLSEEQRQRILACRDLVQLDRWIARAVSVTTAAELFA